MRKALTNILGAVLCCLSAAGAQEGKTITDRSREFLLQKTYLNLPVKNGIQKRLISLIINDKIVREFEIELAPDEPDFWVFLDIGEFRGEKSNSSHRQV